MLLLFVVTLTGCKKEKVALEDLYGKYDFEECVYTNSQNPLKPDIINQKYDSKARYSLKDTSFSFYETEDPTPTISLKFVNYKEEEEILKGIEETAIKQILKGATTRFDVYKLDVNQGYTIIFTKDDVYFVEFRNLSSSVKVVWQIYEIEKRD